MKDYLCFTDGMAMEIVYDNLTTHEVVRADQIIDNEDSWRVLTGCYCQKDNRGISLTHKTGKGNH